MICSEIGVSWVPVEDIHRGTWEKQRQGMDMVVQSNDPEMPVEV